MCGGTNPIFAFLQEHTFRNCTIRGDGAHPNCGPATQGIKPLPDPKGIEIIWCHHMIIITPYYVAGTFDYHSATMDECPLGYQTVFCIEDIPELIAVCGPGEAQVEVECGSGKLYVDEPSQTLRCTTGTPITCRNPDGPGYKAGCSGT